MRRSYVVWDEAANPLVIVELLSDGTYKEDLGETEEPIAAPTKWRVYEEILKIPYYVTFDKETNEVQAFRLEQGVYVPFLLQDKGLWIAEVELWLDLWFGIYYRIERLWLRWKDKDGNWIPTLEERAEQERMQKQAALQVAEQERMQKEQERMQKEAALQVAEQQSQLAQQQSQRADQERIEKEKEREEKQLLAAKLRELGIDPSDIIGKK
jgi:hypothetical protein